MSPEFVDVAGLKVELSLFRFIEDEAIPGSAVESSDFWNGLARAANELGPRLQTLLTRRQALQDALDTFHRSNPGHVLDMESYITFLRDIGYLVDTPPAFAVNTSGIDPEVSSTAGPQLVVPLLNARFAVNAANARWGSLYDALYGSDAICPTDALAGPSYDPTRGAKVIGWVRTLLDDVVPLDEGSHRDVTAYEVDAQGLVARISGLERRLADPAQFVGYQGLGEAPTGLILNHHGLHLQIHVDRSQTIGRTDPAGIQDVLLEAALTTIMDLEDSVAAVDAADKVLGYRNWLQLMQGALEAPVTKGSTSFIRKMRDDVTCTSPDGSPVTLAGRALLFVRHVGHHMTTNAVQNSLGEPVAEGIVDAFVTALGGCHDLRGNTRLSNSRAGSIYAVKPKLHGPDEVELTVDLFERVEQTLGLPRNTIKLGIMDEERRTTVNLTAAIAVAKERIAFINTGFLDRTADEIRTSLHAGPVVRKNDMRRSRWLSAYETANVDAGLACGLAGRAQIGKGMWAAPDNLADMLEQKIAQVQSGATTAWVPSPTAATLHALHYHRVDVAAVHAELAARVPRTTLSDLLAIPLADITQLTRSDILAELDNNVQSTLGYVVRWVNAGLGCSKVPDLAGTPLMEDRATCRISSQHVTNWLAHDVISRSDVEDSLRRMAIVVDKQNAGDPQYHDMAPGYDGHAFLAARELLLEGIEQPNGYTEPVLHRRRTNVKSEEIAK